MQIRVWPENDRVLLKPEPIADGTELAPNNPVMISEMAVTANGAIGSRAGGKVKSVIPKRRILVKTMIYNFIKDFIISLFRPPPSAVPEPPPPPPPLPNTIPSKIHGFM